MCYLFASFLLWLGLVQSFVERVKMYKGNNFKALTLTAAFSDTNTSLVVFSTVIFSINLRREGFRAICNSWQALKRTCLIPWIGAKKVAINILLYINSSCWHLTNWSELRRQVISLLSEFNILRVKRGCYLFESRRQIKGYTDLSWLCFVFHSCHHSGSCRI